MGTTVDNRVVSMKFDNKDFEKNVQTSLSTLEKLNKSLDLQNGAKGLTNLGKAAKGVDMTGISNGVENAGRSFSKMEVIAITALANITNSVVNLGKKILSNIISPITKGGLTRALNLEQANFQLQGLGIEKTDKTSSSYDEVMNAVLGTAYSYDVAAKAASQLAASDIGVTEKTETMLNGQKKVTKYMNKDMTDAILGIAGVASMTGSSFEDISNVFTRVAGQGKVMAQDLNSISARGLNAAAVLAKYLNKSEAEVRDMVSKGKIDFTTFSKAMTEAFGEHAKDSTKTFQGALEDVKAALARIGADIYGPMLTAGRDLINSLTPVVDLVHEELNPAIKTVTTLISNLSKESVAMFNSISFAGSFTNKKLEVLSKDLKDIFGLNVDFKKFDIVTSIVASGMKSIHDYSKGTVNAVDILAKSLGKDTTYVEKLLNENGVTFYDWTKALRQYVSEEGKGYQAIISYFSDLTPITKRLEKVGDFLGVTSEGVNNAMNKTISIFTKNGVEAEKVYKSVANAMGVTKEDLKAGLADGTITAEKFRDAIETLDKDGAFSNLKTGAAEILAFMDTAILSSDKLNNKVNKVRVLLQGLGSAVSILVTIFKTAFKIVGHILSVFSPLGSSIMSALTAFSKWLTKLEKSGKIQEKCAKASEGVAEAVNILKDSISAVVNGAMDEFTEFLEKFKAHMDPVAKGVKNIAGAFKVLATYAIGFAKSSLEKITKFFADSANLFDVIATMDAALIMKKLLDMFSSFGSENVLKGIKKMSETVSDAIENVVEALSSHNKTVRASYIKSLATSLLLVAVAFKILSSIDAKQALVAIGSLKIVMVMLTNMITTLAESTLKLKRFKPKRLIAITTSMIPVAISIVILAKALKNLGSLNAKQIAKGLVGITVLMIAMTKMLEAVTAISKDIRGNGKKLIGTMLSLILLGAAMKMFVSSIEDLAAIKASSLMKAGFALTGIMALLGVFVSEIKKLKMSSTFSKSLTQLGMAFILIGVTVKIITSALKDLAAIKSTSLLKAGLAVSGIMGLMGAFVYLMKKIKVTKANSTNLLKVSGSFVIMAIGVSIFARALQKLSSIPWKEAIVGIGIMAAALGSFLALTKLTKGGDLNATGTGILLFSAAMLVLANACKIFQSVDFEKVIPPLLVFIAGVGILTALAPELGAAAVPLAAFGKSLLLLSSAVAVAGAGLFLIGAGMASIAAGAIAIGPALTSIPMAIAAMIKGVILGFVNMKAEIYEIIETTVSGLLQALIENTPLIFEELGLILEGVILKIDEFTPKLLTSIMTFIYNVLVSLNENIEKFAELGMQIVVNLINGISSKLPDLVDACFNLIINLINGISDAFVEYAPIVRDALLNLGKSMLEAFLAFWGIHSPSKVMNDVGGNIIQGLWNGIKAWASKPIKTIKELGPNMLKAIKGKISDWSDVGRNMMKGLWNGLSGLKDWVVDKVASMGHSILSAIKNVLGIKSPSRKFAEVGMYSMLGLAKGLKDNYGVVEDTAIDTMGDLLSNAYDLMESNLDEPVITPVVDLSNVNSAARSINASLSAQQAMSVSASIAKTPSRLDVATNQILAGMKETLNNSAIGQNGGDPQPITVEVPLNINGREFARATVSDMQDAINRNQVRADRLAGQV